MRPSLIIHGFMPNEKPPKHAFLDTWKLVKRVKIYGDSPELRSISWNPIQALLNLVTLSILNSITSCILCYTSWWIFFGRLYVNTESIYSIGHNKNKTIICHEFTHVYPGKEVVYNVQYVHTDLSILHNKYLIFTANNPVLILSYWFFLTLPTKDGKWKFTSSHPILEKSILYSLESASQYDAFSLTEVLYISILIILYVHAMH
jgi:hypothetical protein